MVVSYQPWVQFLRDDVAVLVVVVVHFVVVIFPFSLSFSLSILLAATDAPTLFHLMTRRRYHDLPSIFGDSDQLNETK